MRILVITAALAVLAPQGMAIAQPPPPDDNRAIPPADGSVTQPAPPPDASAPAPSSAPPVAPPQGGLAASGAGSADAPPVIQMGPPQEVVEAAPAPPQSYPPCSRTLRDSCRNPNPAKEADTRADGTIGG